MLSKKTIRALSVIVAVGFIGPVASVVMIRVYSFDALAVIMIPVTIITGVLGLLFLIVLIRAIRT